MYFMSTTAAMYTYFYVGEAVQETCFGLTVVHQEPEITPLQVSVLIIFHELDNGYNYVWFTNVHTSGPKSGTNETQLAYNAEDVMYLIPKELETWIWLQYSDASQVIKIRYSR